MTQTLDARHDLDAAVRTIIEEARRAGGVLRVGSTARDLAVQMGFDQSREAGLINTLSRQAVMHGIAIEFDTPSAS